MPTDVRINPDTITVSATCSLHSTGNAVTVTIALQLLNALDADLTTLDSSE